MLPFFWHLSKLSPELVRIFLCTGKINFSTFARSVTRSRFKVGPRTVGNADSTIFSTVMAIIIFRRCFRRIACTASGFANPGNPLASSYALSYFFPFFKDGR